MLTIERDRSRQWVLVLQTRAPSFVAGQRYDVRIATVSAAPIDTRGRASDANSLAMPLDNARGLASALARGRGLSIALPRETIPFALDGADRAFADLERCFANAAAGKIRFEGSVVERVLDQAQNGPVQVARPAGSADDADRDYAWNAGPVAGGAREIGIAPGSSFLDMVLARLDGLASRCDGHFSPALDTPQEAPGGLIETGVAACRGTAGNRIAAMVYFRQGEHFGEFVLEAPEPMRAAVLAHRDNIVKIVRTIVLDR